MALTLLLFVVILTLSMLRDGQQARSADVTCPAGSVARAHYYYKTQTTSLSFCHDHEDFEAISDSHCCCYYWCCHQLVVLRCHKTCFICLILLDLTITTHTLTK